MSYIILSAIARNMPGNMLLVSAALHGETSRGKTKGHLATKYVA